MNEIDRLQSEDRINRNRTKAKSTYTDLVGKGKAELDLKMLNNLMKKKGLSDTTDLLGG